MQMLVINCHIGWPPDWFEPHGLLRWFSILEWERVCAFAGFKWSTVDVAQELFCAVTGDDERIDAIGSSGQLKQKKSTTH